MIAAKLLILAVLVVAASSRNLRTDRQNASLTVKTALEATPRTVSAAEAEKDSARDALADVTVQARENQQLVYHLQDTVVKDQVQLRREKEKLAVLEVKQNETDVSFQASHAKLHKKMEPKVKVANKTLAKRSHRASESQSKLAVAEKELESQEAAASSSAQELNASEIAFATAKTHLDEAQVNLTEAASRLRTVKLEEAKKEEELLRAEKRLEDAKKDLSLDQKREADEEKTLDQKLASGKSEQEKNDADFELRKAKLEVRLNKTLAKKEKANKELRIQKEAYAYWEEQRNNLTQQDVQSHDQYTKEDEQFEEKRKHLLKAAGATVAAETAGRVGFDSSSDWAW